MSGGPHENPTLNDARLAAACRALAKFHGALADEPWAGAVEEPSPGLAERLMRIDEGLATGLRELRSAPSPFDWAELQIRRDEYVDLFAPAAAIVRPRLVDGRARRRRLQPCIRDIRREHLLFVGDELTGLVDFGALQMDHPAIDTARLLGECVGDDGSRRDTALAAYRAAAPPQLADAADPALIDAFDGANLVLSPGNWLRWILIEQRRFADRAAVVRRMDELMMRLRRLVRSH
jgi:homoserine kinase type II